ncbi:MAG: folylpolyglutamate synthase/dihydrofolate synthase family protein [Thermodesulfobacteriota bacterium]|nr:folylpolyglutamate synthase/dihydrofolate synthase family protein [Thermodesulfobacteriota bacterium]
MGNIPYQEAVTYLYSLRKFGIKFGLSKISNLLERLGNPHKDQRYVHIAGTNGKGSVAAFIACILEQAGLKVGLYTSPHLIRFTERFRINNKEIAHEEAAEIISDLRHAISPHDPPTFFEAATAMALLYFFRENTDIAIMETGMGGRLDATNVITPLVSVVTNISMEHKFVLGSGLLDIAREKGGIIKEGIDVVTGATQPTVVNLLQSICDSKRACLWRVGKDIRYRTTGSGLHYYGLRRRLNGLQPGLDGRFQVRNSAVALAALEILEGKGIKISSEHIRKGLKNTLWPGRMQVISKDPTIMLDGAHNPAAVRALAYSISTELKYRRLILVIGMMKDKDKGAMLRAIVPFSDYVIYTKPACPRAADPRALMSAASCLRKPGEVVPSLTNALKRSIDMADPRDLIVISGSLFVVGEAMTFFGRERS